MIELVHIFHHCHIPLAQLQELGHLLVDDTSGDKELSEGGGELLPCCQMIRLLCGLEGFPPCTHRPQKLLRRKVHLLLVGHSEQPKFLL